MGGSENAFLVAVRARKLIGIMEPPNAPPFVDPHEYVTHTRAGQFFGSR